MKQLHPLQRQILQKLLFTPKLRYTEMKPDTRMENNQFDFHLDTLIAQGLIGKDKQFYHLSHKGKDYANRMDSPDEGVMIQAKLSVLVACMRTGGVEKEYLIYTRLKHPFYGAQGFLSGKIRYGENVVEAAERELKEETNLEGKPEVIAIWHYRVYDATTKELVEDKYMFFSRFVNPVGEMINNNEGAYEWVKESQLKEKVTNHFESFAELMKDVRTMNEYEGAVKLVESDVYTDKF